MAAGTLGVGGAGNRKLLQTKLAAKGLVYLQNALGISSHVYQGHRDQFGKLHDGHAIGDTISIPKPIRFVTNSGRVATNRQGIVEENTSFTINRQEHVWIGANAIEKTLNMPNFDDLVLKPAMQALAAKVDLSIHQALMRNTYFGSGTPGNALATGGFNFARAAMMKVAVPMDDGNICAVIDPFDMASLEGEMKTFFHERLVQTAVQGNYNSPLATITPLEAAQAVTHTVGSHGGTPLVAGANQSGNSLNIDGGTNSTTGFLRRGDTFTIAGVFEVNIDTLESTGRLQRFVVTADVSTSGSGAATVPIEPEMNDGTLTTVDGEGNPVSKAAYQTVSALPADNAAITVIGNADTEYRRVGLFHKNAVTFASVPIQVPANDPNSVTVTHPETGISITVSGDFNILEMRDDTRFDVLWGAKLIDPRLSHVIWTREALAA
ncbi:MAG: P22 phage major capsid protein family protein [Pseudomonadota bacterium]